MTDARIYIVDNDPLATSGLEAALAQESGFEVQTFASPGELARVAEELPPDAVIAGLSPAQGDGLAVLSELGRTDPDLVGILMTSINDAESSTQAIAAVGPLRHIRKPCDISDVLPKLRAALERRQLARALRTAQEALSTRDSELRESTRQAAEAAAKLRSTHRELRAATERLFQAEQLAAVGRVSTGIAHELSRQLALVGYAEAIKSRVGSDPELIELADIIISAQKRLCAMVDEIRDFAAAEGAVEGELEREPADMVAVVDEALAIMRYDRDVRQREIVRRYQARPLAALHRTKFAQVVINLVSNAVLATKPGDAIIIEVDIERGHRAHMASVTVTDSGEGMPGEVLARLGEPFFTTRGDRGSGLGVGICMRIVEEHGGRITFDSVLGQGTAARVIVPLLHDAGTREIGR